MRVTTFVGFALGAKLTYGQVGSWGQCGGVGYTGATTCVSGFYCSYGNPYYSQCIPGAASSSSSSSIVKTSSSSDVKTSSSSNSQISSSFTLVASPTSVASGCTAAFTPISASAFVAALSPGWNLGNTLDAIPNEGSWNNPPALQSTLAAIRANGYNSIRIPVTWAYHFTTTSPTWTVDPTFLQRVETVVDQALALGFYVIVNVHHDSWTWADPSAAGANVTLIEEKFGRLWSQIGKQLACKSSKLLFEPLNEPSGSTQSDADVLNTLDDIFLQSINQAGGYNPQRVVSLSGLGMNSDKTSQWFKRGTTYPNQPWALQFHYYGPYSFIFNAWGNTIWGSDADKATIQADFQNLKNNFTGIPTFVGEWDASVIGLPTEQAARWKYIDYFVRLCRTFGYGSVMWDNGQDQFNRTTNTWYDPVDQSINLAATAGIPNALADSTTDPSATTQSTGADLFHRVGDPVIAQSIPYILNGNTLKSIKNPAGAAISTSSYSISSTGTVTFTAAYLSTLYTSTSAAGVKDTLTLTFSAGTPLTLMIVQYDTPVFPTTTFKINTAADLSIPVTYKGLPEVAAVKAILADGTYLADSWTVDLGPLQQARWTYSNWQYNAGNLIISQAGQQAIAATGQSVTLTVEFFPRSVGQNSVNITLTQ